MNSMVPIIMGSDKDLNFSKKIAQGLEELDVPYDFRVASADKYPDFADEHIQDFDNSPDRVAYVMVAGRSNRLGGYATGRTIRPTIACPPVESFPDDIWSSLRNASDSPLITVAGQENAAKYAASVISMIGDKETRKGLRTMKGLPNDDSPSIVEAKSPGSVIWFDSNDEISNKKFSDMSERMAYFAVNNNAIYLNQRDWHNFLDYYDQSSKMIHILVSKLNNKKTRDFVSGTSSPVIVCPPYKDNKETKKDVYKFLDDPFEAGIVMDPGNAVQASIRIMGLYDHSKANFTNRLAEHKTRLQKKMREADEEVRKTKIVVF